MKYRIVVLMGLLLLLLTGCKEKNDVQILPEVETTPVADDRPMISLLEEPGLVVSDVEVQEDHLSFSLTNTAQNYFQTASYGGWVEMEQDGVWYRLGEKNPHTEEALIIKPGVTKQRSTNLHIYDADRFAPGNYRFVMEGRWLEGRSIVPIAENPLRYYYLTFTIAE